MRAGLCWGGLDRWDEAVPCGVVGSGRWWEVLESNRKKIQLSGNVPGGGVLGGGGRTREDLRVWLSGKI